MSALAKELKVDDAGFNILVAPTRASDPLTAFDVDISEGYMVTGTAAGHLMSWRIDHALKDKFYQECFKDEEKPQTEVKIPAELTRAPSELDLDKDAVTVRCVDTSSAEHDYLGFLMAQQSLEGIRCVFIRNGNVYAMIGDLHIKFFTSYHTPTYKLIKYKRKHNWSYCSRTASFESAGKALVMMQGSREHQLLDVDDLKQYPVKLPLPDTAIPIFYDSYHLIWIDHDEKNGTKTAVVLDFSTFETICELHFDKAHKFYSNFQIAGDTVVHICCHCKLKVWNVNRPEAPVYTIEGHRGRVVNFILQDNGKEIISLGSDNKIKIWRNGRCIYKFKRINGSFQKNYPYLIKQYGSLLFYTADEGVYVLRLPDNYRPAEDPPHPPGWKGAEDVEEGTGCRIA